MKLPSYVLFTVVDFIPGEHLDSFWLSMRCAMHYKTQLYDDIMNYATVHFISWNHAGRITRSDMTLRIIEEMTLEPVLVSFFYVLIIHFALVCRWTRPCMKPSWWRSVTSLWRSSVRENRSSLSRSRSPRWSVSFFFFYKDRSDYGSTGLISISEMRSFAELKDLNESVREKRRLGETVGRFVSLCP